MNEVKTKEELEVELNQLLEEFVTLADETIKREKDFREWLLQVLEKEKQPGAGELLASAEEKYGWKIRYSFASVINDLRRNKDVKSYIRDYLVATLSDEAINDALRGTAKPTQEFKSTLDDLFKRSKRYRSSTEYRKALEFAARFRDYAPYNNFLVKTQNPSCSFYATERDWINRFHRQVKEDAHPLLILAPMHPLMLVYDLDDTDGEEPIPEHFLQFAETEGNWKPEFLQRTFENAERHKVLVQFKDLSSLHGGFATTRLRDGKYKMRTVIHNKLSERSKYAVLCHELAHILLGHLGSDKDNWWASRINLNRSAVEIEAESVAYIVCTRLGILTSSSQYIASFLKTDIVPDNVSYELIFKVASKIEEMSERLLPEKKTRR